MLAEAGAMGRPLYIFDLGDGDAPWWRLSHSWRYKPLSHRLAMRFGPGRMRRDVGRIQDSLIADGRASWLTPAQPEIAFNAEEGGTAGDSPVNLAADELRQTAQAVRRLVEPH